MPTSGDGKKDELDLIRDKIKNEPITSFLKTDILEISSGYSRVSMMMRPEYQNFHGVIFGGIIMSLADQALGSASNSMAYPSVASTLNVYFISSAKVGDRLTAECKVIKSGKRAGFAEVAVTNQDDKLIAKAVGVTIPVKREESGTEIGK